MTHGSDDVQSGFAGPPAGEMRPRPALHFAPVKGWMNDPNGLIHWNGRTHMFYQHNPAAPVHGNIAWGHASSADLWTWADHPLALEPDPSGPDRDGCWSGCAVIAQSGRPRLLYTGVRGEHELPCQADTADPDLARWDRDPGNPVIAVPPQGEATRAFRDHSAWRTGADWYQVIGGGLKDHGGALFLYRSADLRHWEYVGIFAAAADYGLDDAVWECPDVFVLGATTVVVVSICGGPSRWVMWMTGQIREQRFVPEAYGRCDNGYRFYAPQSLQLAGGRRVAFGWLQESLEELAGPDRTRVGVMSLPRELYLDTSGVLQSRPARELDQARGEPIVDRLVHEQISVPVAWSARSGQAAELSFTPIGGDATGVRLRLAGARSSDVRIWVTTSGIEITEGSQWLTERAPPGTSAPGVVGQVRVYYDSGILEVFSPPAATAVIICSRDGAYDRLDAEISGFPGAAPCRASLTIWPSGSKAVANRRVTV